MSRYDELYKQNIMREWHKALGKPYPLDNIISSDLDSLLQFTINKVREAERWNFVSKVAGELFLQMKPILDSAIEETLKEVKQGDVKG